MAAACPSGALSTSPPRACSAPLLVKPPTALGIKTTKWHLRAWRRARGARGASWQSGRGPPHLVAAAVEAAVKLVKDAVVLVQVDQLRAARQLIWEPFTALQGWN